MPGSMLSALCQVFLLSVIPTLRVGGILSNLQNSDLRTLLKVTEDALTGVAQWFGCFLAN